MLTAPRRNGHKLSALLDGIAPVEPGEDTTVFGLSLDSRQVTPGDVFFALDGHAEHGVKFVREAADKGAAAVVSEALDITTKTAIPIVRVQGLRSKLGLITNRFSARRASNSPPSPLPARMAKPQSARCWPAHCQEAPNDAATSARLVWENGRH